MDEIYSSAPNNNPKRFFISALICEGIAVILLVAVLLSLRFLTPKFFKNVRTFYIENVCFNAATQKENLK